MILSAFETRRRMIDQCYWLSHAWIRTFASQIPYSIYATVICRCRHGNAWVLLSWKVSIVSTLHGPCLESLMHPCLYSWQPCSLVFVSTLGPGRLDFLKISSGNGPARPTWQAPELRYLKDSWLFSWKSQPTPWPPASPASSSSVFWLSGPCHFVKCV